MHLNPYSAPSIKDFLAVFNKKLESLIEILQHEQKVLTKGSADEISTTAQEKLAYMQALSNFIANYFNSSSVSKNNGLEESIKMLNEVCIGESIVEGMNHKIYFNLAVNYLMKIAYSLQTV